MCMHLLRKPYSDFLRSPAAQGAAKVAVDHRGRPPRPACPEAYPAGPMLQQLHRAREDKEWPLDGPNHVVAGRYFDAASRYVTSQDSRMVSPRASRRFYFQGTYHIATGDWRQAWLVFHRAIGIARLMGLHTSRLRQRRDRPVGGGVAQTEMSPDYLWFRLIYMDRYLSAHPPATILRHHG